MWKLELVRSLTQTSFSRRSIAAARVHEGRGGHQQRLCQIAVHLPRPAFCRTTASLEDRTCSVCCDSGTRPRAYGRQQRRSGDSSGTLRLRLMLLKWFLESLCGWVVGGWLSGLYCYVCRRCLCLLLGKRNDVFAQQGSMCKFLIRKQLSNQHETSNDITL